MSKYRAITKRLVATVLGVAIIWFFLQQHRAWVWVYFQSMMGYKDPTAELATIAQASISAITTIALTSITTVGAIVVWFVTGNVLAIQSMFKFVNTTEALAEIKTATTSHYSKIEEKAYLEELNRGD